MFPSLLNLYNPQLPGAAGDPEGAEDIGGGGDPELKQLAWHLAGEMARSQTASLGQEQDCKLPEGRPQVSRKKLMLHVVSPGQSTSPNT